MPNSRHNCGEICGFSTIPPTTDHFMATAEHVMVEDKVAIGKRQEEGDMHDADARERSAGEFEAIVRARFANDPNLKKHLEAVGKCAQAFLDGTCIFAQQEGV